MKLAKREEAPVADDVRIINAGVDRASMSAADRGSCSSIKKLLDPDVWKR